MAFLNAEGTEALEQATPGGITIHRLIDRYVETETPYKARGKQRHDRRTAELFKSFFSPTRRAETLNLGDWNRFIRQRREYRIGPPSTLSRARAAEQTGTPLPPIGDRQIEYDLRFLWAVLTWATKTGDARGTVLLPMHPLKQCVQARHWPKEKSPSRPTLTPDQYLAMVDVAPTVDWRFHVALILAHETGHRIGSIRRLRWSDVEAREGWIRWRADTDKVGWEHWTPVTSGIREALDRAHHHRSEEGPDRPPNTDWVLPSPSDPSRPCSRHIVRDWWKQAQKKAGLRAIPRLGWHALRRKFANDLRHAPLKDLASLGGWKDTQTLLKCYLKEDEEAMLEATRNRRSPHRRHDSGNEEE